MGAQGEIVFPVAPRGKGRGWGGNFRPSEQFLPKEEKKIILSREKGGGRKNYTLYRWRAGGSFSSELFLSQKKITCKARRKR